MFYYFKYEWSNIFVMSAVFPFTVVWIFTAEEHLMYCIIILCTLIVFDLSFAHIL